MIWSKFLRNYGPNLIKWYIWVYNIDVDQKLWSLTVNWPWLTFFPQYSWFLGQLSNWLSKNVIQGLKFVMSNLRGPRWCMKVIWSIEGPKILVQTQTLISVYECKVMPWAEQNPTLVLSSRSLVRNILINERENFGIQQFPLFNLLEPEELDWQVLPLVTRR